MSARRVGARKKKARREAEHETGMRRIARIRGFAAIAGFVPLTAALLCGTGIATAFCAVPREWYLGLWAAAFGAFVGLSIRLVLERRRYQREGS